MKPDFPMIDDTALVLVDELNGIFDGNDVILPVLVGVIDHGREGRRLPTSRRARDQHEAFVQHGHTGEDRRQPQRFCRHDLGRDPPEDGSMPVFLLEEIGPEASQSRELVREVEIAGPFKRFFFIVGSDLVQHRS